jgi:hypothetical protein
VLPIVATPVLALVHVPPVGVELNVVVAPVHTLIVPVMAVGCVLTVTAAAAKQPPVNVYVIFDVPELTPVTIPVLPIVATPVLALVQVPPDGEELNVVVAPVHTLIVPVIAVGCVLTVTTAAAKQPPLRV